MVAIGHHPAPNEPPAYIGGSAATLVIDAWSLVILHSAFGFPFSALE